MENGMISIATLLRKPALIAVTLNNHQLGFMQAPDGRQMYLKNTIRRHVRRGRTHVIVG